MATANRHIRNRQVARLLLQFGSGRGALRAGGQEVPALKVCNDVFVAVRGSLTKGFPPLMDRGGDLDEIFKTTTMIRSAPSESEPVLANPVVQYS